MRRRRRGRLPAPPPPPDGLIWDLDEWVSHRRYAWPHVEEMQAFDALPPSVKAELRRTGESALAYLEWRRQQRSPFDW